MSIHLCEKHFIFILENEVITYNPFYLLHFLCSVILHFDFLLNSQFLIDNPMKDQIKMFLPYITFPHFLHLFSSPLKNHLSFHPPSLPPSLLLFFHLPHSITYFLFSFSLLLLFLPPFFITFSLI